MPAQWNESREGSGVQSSEGPDGIRIHPNRVGVTVYPGPHLTQPIGSGLFEVREVQRTIQGNTVEWLEYRCQIFSLNHRKTIAILQGGGIFSPGEDPILLRDDLEIVSGPFLITRSDSRYLYKQELHDLVIAKITEKPSTAVLGALVQSALKP